MSTQSYIKCYRRLRLGGGSLLTLSTDVGNDSHLYFGMKVKDYYDYHRCIIRAQVLIPSVIIYLFFNFIKQAKLLLLDCYQAGGVAANKLSAQLRNLSTFVSKEW